MVHVHWMRVSHSDWTKMDDPKLIQERLAAVEAIGTYAVACGVWGTSLVFCWLREQKCVGPCQTFGFWCYVGLTTMKNHWAFFLFTYCWFYDCTRKNVSYIWLPLGLYDYVFMKTMINLWLPSVVKMLQYLFNVFRYWQRQKTNRELHKVSLPLGGVVLLVNCLIFCITFWL